MEAEYIPVCLLTLERAVGDVLTLTTAAGSGFAAVATVRLGICHRARYESVRGGYLVDVVCD